MPKPFTEDMIENLLTTILRSNDPFRERDYLVLYLCSRLGLRISECLKIRLDHIDFDKRILTIPKENCKNGRERIIYLVDDVLNKLVNYILKNQNRFRKGFIIYNNKKFRYHANYITFYKRFIIYMKEAGLDKHEGFMKNGFIKHQFRIHDLRTYFCIKVREANPEKPLSKLKHVTGHLSEMTLEKFYINKGVIALEEQKECLAKAFG